MDRLVTLTPSNFHCHINPKCWSVRPSVRPSFRPSGRPVSVRCYISVTYEQIQFKIDVSICYQEGIDPMYNFFRCLLACWSYCPLLLKNNLFFSVRCPISETD